MSTYQYLKFSFEQTSNIVILVQLSRVGYKSYRQQKALHDNFKYEQLKIKRKLIKMTDEILVHSTITRS